MNADATPPPHHLIAYCDRCKHLFKTGAIAVTNAKIVVHDVRVTCPKCGHSAEMLSGTYSAIGDTLNVFLSPNVSLAAWASFLVLLDDVGAKRLALDEAKARAEQIDHRLGAAFDTKGWSDQARATLYSAILVSMSTLTVAAATVAGPYLAPAPVVTIQLAAPRSNPTLRERLLRGIRHHGGPLSPLRTPTTSAEKQSPPGTSRHVAANPGAKHHPDKKAPRRSD